MRRSRTTGRPVPPVGAAALTTLASFVALGAVLLLAAPPLVDLRRRVVAGEALSDLPLDVLLASLAAAALAGCGIWLATVTAATAVEMVTGASSALARALTPACVRRVVIVCCGLAVGGAGAMPAATADPHPGDEPVARTPASVASALVGLPLPDRAVGAAAPPARPGPGAAAPPPRSHRVRPGDSLWSIADDWLPAAAPVAEVDTTWRRIYRANRPAIGTDPNLIVPGTRLRLPGPTWRTPRDDPRQAEPRPGRPTTLRKDAS